MSYVDVIVSSPIGNIPSGGTDGQVLVKQSGVDFDYEWESVSGAGASDWDDVFNKPSTFPPSAHTHPISEVVNLQTTLDNKQPLATVLTNTTAAFTTAQETKLSGIATGATVNSTDAELRDRSTHTGSQLSSTISDLTEAVQDIVGVAIVAGTNVTVSYNDTTGETTINATGGGGGGGDTNLAVANRTTTTLDITSDTGTDATVPVATTSLAGLLSSADKTKLDGIAASATANSSDATLLARANHTGTQAASTISDFAEVVQDTVALSLTEGTNVTLTYDDGAGTITVDAAGTNLTVINRTTTSLDVTSDTGTDATIPVATGSLAGLLSASDKTKLDGVATNASANSADATLLARANHTGTQTSSTISDFDEAAQDAVGAMVNSTLVYTDATPVLGRAAITGDVTIAAGSNAATIANDAVTFAKMQNITSARVLGRTSASSGDVEELAAGAGISIASGTIINTSHITVSTTAPSSPVTNQLWLDIN